MGELRISWSSSAFEESCNPEDNAPPSQPLHVSPLALPSYYNLTHHQPSLPYPSICTDFMGLSHLHSLSSSCAASPSPPSSCCTSPTLLPLHDLFQHLEDEVDCTLSLGTAATRKRSKPHISPQMSRSESPALDRENGSSKFMFSWQPAPFEVNDSISPSGLHHLEKITHCTSQEDHFSGKLSFGDVSRTGGLLEKSSRKFYPTSQNLLSNQRPWTPFLGNSAMMNEAILELLPSNQGSKFLSPSLQHPTYFTIEEYSANPGSMLQFAHGKTLIEQCDMPRTCAHCGTTKTPLWRNGPGGPKSLCNACGIRYKKAGRRVCSFVRS